MINWKRIGLINYEFPNIESYNKDFINIDKELPDDVELIEMNKNLSNIDGLEKIDLGALGEEVTSFVEKNYNSGIYLSLPKNTKLIQPLNFEFKLDEDNPSLVDFNIVVAEAGSEATLIFDYSSEGNLPAFHNGFTKVYAEENSQINIVKIQRLNDQSYNFDSNIAVIEGNGNINWISVEIGSAFSAANFSTILDGMASESNLHSIYLGDGDRKMDLEYTMIHKGMRTDSNIQTRGVLKDKSKKVFRGNLDFKRGSKKSKGVEEEYVILLDPTVKSDSIPALLCGEDDVEGEHAASAGQIDESKLFYLMSRGLDEREAKKLIVEASFAPIIDRIPSDHLQTLLSEEIERRLI